jgi:hypothetical protein
MRLIYFILRLLALPLLLVFLLVGTAVYIILLGFAWVAIGETIKIWLTYPDWRP